MERGTTARRHEPPACSPRRGRNPNPPRTAGNAWNAAHAVGTFHAPSRVCQAAGVARGGAPPLDGRDAARKSPLSALHAVLARRSGSWTQQIQRHAGLGMWRAQSVPWMGGAWGASGHDMGIFTSWPDRRGSTPVRYVTPSVIVASEGMQACALPAGLCSRECDPRPLRHRRIPSWHGSHPPGEAMRWWQPGSWDSSRQSRRTP